MKAMASASTRTPRPWGIPFRVLLLTLLFTFLVFVITLFLSILGIMVRAASHGLHPNVAMAYRSIAVPVAAVAAPFILIGTLVFELRHYRQAKVLAAIERMH